MHKEARETTGSTRAATRQQQSQVQHNGPVRLSGHIQSNEIVVRSRNIDGFQLIDCVRDEFDDAPQLKDELLRNRIDTVHSTSFLHWQASDPQPSHDLRGVVYRTRSVVRFQAHTLPDVQNCLGYHFDSIV